MGCRHQSPAPEKVAAAIPTTVQPLAQHDVGCESLACAGLTAVGMSISCLLTFTEKAQGCGSTLTKHIAQAWGGLSGARVHLLLATEHLQLVIWKALLRRKSGTDMRLAACGRGEEREPAESKVWWRRATDIQHAPEACPVRGWTKLCY